MNAKPYVLADCDIPFLKGVWNPTPACNISKARDFALATRPGPTLWSCGRARTATNGCSGGTPVGLIATATIGHDHIDSEYCSRHGIAIATAQGCNARGVLQYVMAALAALAVRDEWSPADRTLGVVGVGNVGSLIAEYGELFGFRVLRCDPPKAERNPQDDYLPLGELLPQADIVTCHVPLNRTGNYPTLRMASASFFEAIKPGAIFINTSRGKIVDDEALIGALQSGRLSHAGRRHLEQRAGYPPDVAKPGHVRHAAHRRLLDPGKSRRERRRPYEPSANFSDSP